MEALEFRLATSQAALDSWDLEVEALRYERLTFSKDVSGKESLQVGMGLWLQKSSR